jgi:hypothetical protein
VLLVCTVYSEIALSRKQFGIGHIYIYTFLLIITDNIDLSSWDILYIALSLGRDSAHLHTRLELFTVLASGDM